MNQNTIPPIRWRPWVYITIFLLSAAFIVWVFALGLDTWPTGTMNTLPRIVPLMVLVICWLICTFLMGVWAKRRQYRIAWLVPIISILIFGLGMTWGIRKIIRWHATIWLGEYLLCDREPYHTGTKDVLFCFIDHFEPDGIWNNLDKLPLSQRISRMESWESAYPDAIEGHRDSDGFKPQHTWTFPIQHSIPQVVQWLSQWPGRGWGEIEYHLHHGKTWDAARVQQQMVADLAALRAIGACTHGYAFVHGRYALAAGDWAECQVVNELDILQNTGCYADFTFPNLYTPAQPSQVNSIFYARSNHRPKPHDHGQEIRFASTGHEDGLILIQGAMGMAFTKVVLEDSNLSLEQIPEPARIDLWLGSHIHVIGQPNWIFIIVHSHSASEYAQNMLWDGNMQRLWSALETRFLQPGWRLHYVTAREVYNIVKAAEAGKTGNPGQYRNYLIPPPENRSDLLPSNVVPVSPAGPKKE